MFHQSTANHMEAAVSPAFLSSLTVKVLSKMSQNIYHLKFQKRQESKHRNFEVDVTKNNKVSSLKHNHFQYKSLPVYTTFTRNADGFNTSKRMGPKRIQLKHQLAQQIPQEMFHQSTTKHIEAAVSPAFLSSLPVKILFKISQNISHLNIRKRKESSTETVRLI